MLFTKMVIPRITTAAHETTPHRKYPFLFVDRDSGYLSIFDQLIECGKILGQYSGEHIQLLIDLLREFIPNSIRLICRPVVPCGNDATDRSKLVVQTNREIERILS